MEIEQETEKEALRILWRVGQGDVRVSRALLYKYSSFYLGFQQ